MVFVIIALFFPRKRLKNQLLFIHSHKFRGLKMRVLLLLHGFLGSTSDLGEINDAIKESKDNPFDNIWNLSYYDSDYGLDITKPNSIRTPIFNPNTEVHSLVIHLYNILEEKLTPSHAKNVQITIIAHSMGGLLARALIKYKCNQHNQKQELFPNCFIETIILLGTPNHGTLLANKWLFLPVQELIDFLTFIYNLPSSISIHDLIKNNSQMTQMETNSLFLKSLNKPETIKYVKIVTVAGLNNKTFGRLPLIWEPFIFWKIRINSVFPWIHIGQIQNDGLVQSNSVSLKGETVKNFTVKDANHLNMLEWKSNPIGKSIYKKLNDFIKF